MRALIVGLCCGSFFLFAPTIVLAADMTYSYDALGRLTQVGYPSGYSITYAYDAAGNRTTISAMGAPTAVDDSAATNDNTAVTLDPRINDTHSYSLTITAPGGTAVATGHGSVTGAGTTVTYTPSSGFHGTDSFPYAISDGHSAAVSATVTVVVNSPPVVGDVHINTGPPSATGPASITFDPRSNDSDPDGDPMTVRNVDIPSSPSHGTAQRVNNATITYSSNVGYHGSDSFSYGIADGHNHIVAGTVYVTVP